jgi:hypothetical protein
MNGNKIDVVLDKLNPFIDSIETLGAPYKNFYVKELQVRAPFNAHELLVFGSYAQQNLFHVVAIGEKLYTAQENRPAGYIDKSLFSFSPEPAAGPGGTNNHSNILTHSKSSL